MATLATLRNTIPSLVRMLTSPARWTITVRPSGRKVRSITLGVLGIQPSIFRAVSPGSSDWARALAAMRRVETRRAPSAARDIARSDTGLPDLARFPVSHDRGTTAYYTRHTRWG